MRAQLKKTVTLSEVNKDIRRCRDVACNVSTAGRFFVGTQYDRWDGSVVLLRNRDETEDNAADWVFGRASRVLADKYLRSVNAVNVVDSV